ncbi:MAG: adenine deaminase [Methanoregula sp.]|jgi:adenine deaminase|nr:adenine deaminase [Methanoregula sp.]
METFSKDMLDAARGLIPADAVFKNASIFNPFSCDWEKSSLAVKNGRVLGLGPYTGITEFDFSGLFIIPGLIDAHVHIESSLLVPREYARLVASHGTTTVIADPHEIANVAGTQGIDFMLAERSGSAIDIQYLLPSCVPATPMDTGGATLDARDLRQFIGRKGILGLGEMMNVPGVLAADPGIGEKLKLFSIRDGHAPQLLGKDLNAYILAGLQSDHECTRLAEAEEKLRRGMYIFIREGSTECNISDLIGLVTQSNVSRCSFATDDCHADILFKEGHIDRCVRRAIECGLKPELALRMATLSPAERFGLSDRGALTPGRRADFLVVEDPRQFIVKKVFVKGIEVLQSMFQETTPDLHAPFPCQTPSAEAIRITGSGEARVIGLIPHQITTKSLRYPLAAQDIPDFTRDILKVVVCNRYRDKESSVGLVHGFSLKRGAIASSISHDAHNIIAVGTSEGEIQMAIEEVIRSRGAMVAVVGEIPTILPLDCGGLMSTLPYPEVVKRLEDLHTVTGSMGSIDNPFMYLSFLALSVIPTMRITDRGLFDVGERVNVPLFIK